MLTREQWQDAARFAGVELSGIWHFGHHVADYPLKIRQGFPTPWTPHADWNDFGPLWVKLERWLAKEFGVQLNSTIASLELQFKRAIDTGTDKEIMQAGLLLAAAIGKTMREAKP